MSNPSSNERLAYELRIMAAGIASIANEGEDHPEAKTLRQAAAALSSPVETDGLICEQAHEDDAEHMKPLQAAVCIGCWNKLAAEVIELRKLKGASVETSETYHGIGCATRRGAQCNCAAADKPEKAKGRTERCPHGVSHLNHCNTCDP